jgi:hypothetical protein
MKIKKMIKKLNEYDKIDHELYLKYCSIYIRLLDKYKVKI